MYGKFYKLLIIWNFHLTIPHIQPGMMEWWNNGIAAFNALVFKEKAASCLRPGRLFARRAPSHYSIFPTFHYSSCDRSELSSNNYKNYSRETAI
jgi:hypothetical protein